ncbi:30S ribosomal protein S16 [Candidatus Peribacteria bacterium RIFCSPHIGHO2_01_FULL_55_13]|nr:MAG: 30S ribosomal protein S16 [Candidatus Peribacteria bacterium RIFCSPHIGHO2_01_FULL_55_13]OGJ64699.1 MAG: 30S ribosomal protein S16 [Candidatus Peribacteria bacterium RIFCSPHIGHO2_12_FULL_55_11]
MIRLQRTGRENLPTYRIVVAEKARPVKGGVLEHVGHYLPAQNPPEVVIKKDRIEYWISKGATASDTAARLLSKNGVKGLEKHIVRYAKQRPKNEEPLAPAAPATAAPAAPVAEAAPVAAPEEAKPAA